MKNCVDFSKFPSVLKQALEDKSVSFTEDTLFQYQPLEVYRVIQRPENTDNNQIKIIKKDFYSYIELGKRYRGSINIGTYSCSFFKTKDELIAALSLPRPKRKIIKGTIHDDLGPIRINESNKHVDLWLYKEANPQDDFILDE